MLYAYGVTLLSVYVEAYRTLATVLKMEAEQLWRELWYAQPGTVRGAFSSLISQVASEQNGGQDRRPQDRLLLQFADSLFHTRHLRDTPDRDHMTQLWMRALS